jgi:hypothetical protein
MHIAGRDMGVGDYPAPPVHGAVIEIEEPLGLAVPHHVARIRVGAADLRLLYLGRPGPLRQGRLAMRRPVGLHRTVQIVPASGARFRHHLLVIPLFVCRSLKMGAVGVKHLAAHQPGSQRRLHDPVENLLRHLGCVESAAAVLAEGRGVEHPVRQPQPQEPAIRHVDFDLAHQPPLGPDTEQIPDEQRLEENLRRDRRATVVGAIQPLGQIADEAEINRRFNLAQKMIGWHQALERHHLEFG